MLYRVKRQQRVGKKNVNKEGTGNREGLWLNFEVHREDNRVFFKCGMKFSLFASISLPLFFIVQKIYHTLCSVLIF